MQMEYQRIVKRVETRTETTVNGKIKLWRTCP